MVRYFGRSPSNGVQRASPRFARVRVANAPVVRVRKQRFRTLDVSDVDLRRPVQGPRTACDSAEYGPPSEDLGGEVGNCPEVVDLLPIASASAVPYRDFQRAARVVRAAGSRTVVGFLAIAVLDELAKNSKPARDFADYPRCGPDCVTIAENSYQLGTSVRDTLRTLTTQIQSGESQSSAQVDKTIAADLDAIRGLKFDINGLVKNQEALERAGEASGALIRGAKTLGTQVGQLQVALERTAALAVALAAEKTFKPSRRNKRKQKCYERRAAWRSVLDGNRRWNLCVLTQDKTRYTKMTTAGTGRRVKAYEAHHLFPRALEDEFAQAGIQNVNLPGFLCWQGHKKHQGAKNQYNARWQGVLNRIRARSGRGGRLRYSDRPEVLKVGEAFARGGRGSEFACVANRANFALSSKNPTGMTWNLGAGL